MAAENEQKAGKVNWKSRIKSWKNFIFRRAFLNIFLTVNHSWGKSLNYSFICASQIEKFLPLKHRQQRISRNTWKQLRALSIAQLFRMLINSFEKAEKSIASRYKSTPSLSNSNKYSASRDAELSRTVGGGERERRLRKIIEHLIQHEILP